MRAILAAVVMLLACGRVHGDEKVYLVKCRIWDSIPAVGILHHQCILICDEGTPPFITDSRGHRIANPACTYFGTRPKTTGFTPERTVVEIKAIEVNVPASVVRERMAAYQQPYSWLKFNCQYAAKQVLGAR